MNAALSSVRSRALETISSITASNRSNGSLPTSSYRTDKPKRSFDRPRLFTRNRSDDGTLNTPSKSTLLFLLGCLAWYLASSLSSNTSKALLSKPKLTDPELSHLRPSAAFPYPVTLTLIHFGFVNVCCLICASPSILGNYALTTLVKPSFSRVTEVGQLAFFNVLGQALSSLAISRVPVATVHTIKALSPLFTVLSYTYLFGVTYSSKTYLSLLPLTLGVMMACTGLAVSADDLVGFSAALASTFVFVAQNIYSKKLLRKGEEGRMDKINILFYSSACSFLLLLPMALYYDGSSLFFSSSSSWSATDSFPHSRGTLVLWLLLVNGLVHFAQNILAFNVLSMVSPVTYSIASLLKRVFVIVLAIIWFRQSVSLLQWCGISMTFYGLWMYNDSKTKEEVKKGEKRVARKQDIASGLDQGILPLTSNAGAGGAASVSGWSSAGVHARHHLANEASPSRTSFVAAAAPPRSTYVKPNVGGWNDVPESLLVGPSRSYIHDPTKSLPSPPDSDKET